MSFENCKQIEINGKVFDCEKPSWMHSTILRSVITVDGERYDIPNLFLEAIGAKPVVDVPKKGEHVWRLCVDVWIPYISAGKMSGDYLLVYGPKDPVTGTIEYGKIDNWKPFNPEELE